jgi:UDP-N-acetylmuramoyl-L-alanyl-D-glutamate--2,6-diaminopimelate ligase
LNIIATTGTDGKTTTSMIIKELIDLYSDCAYIGTNGLKTRYYEVPTNLTTPKPIYLHKYLKRCVNDHIPYVSMEASSQGINEHRMDDVEVSRAIFTNLTHEHLDYHKTIDAYFECKLKLFTNLKPSGYAIINADQGEFTKKIMDNTPAQVITYGKSMDAMFRIEHIKTSLHRTTFNLITPEKTYENVVVNLFGDYNVYNVVASLAVLYSFDFDLDLAINKLYRLNQIEGRMNIIDDYSNFKVIVDFAHTPNALKSLLSNIKLMEPTRRVILVFGSAGERDKIKRPIMGEIAETYCDKIFITNEDPKGEEPLDIIHDIYKGIKNPLKTEIILNRKEAIKKALQYANEDDIVLITGKGNENTQVFKNFKIDHNDIEVTLEILNKQNQEINLPVYMDTKSYANA